MRNLKLSLLLLVVTLFAVSTAYAADTFKAKLTPKEEVAKPKANSSGKAHFKLVKDGNELEYRLQVKHVKDANAAHIHLGKKGEDGPPVVTLYSGTKKGTFTGLLAEGKITSQDLMGDFKGKPLSELVNLMRTGDTYVNVHTEQNPDGEIRGQIK